MIRRGTDGAVDVQLVTGARAGEMHCDVPCSDQSGGWQPSTAVWCVCWVWTCKVLRR